MNTEESRDNITSEFGDLFAYNISVNFQTKMTEIHFGENITENSKPIKRMIFENVVWQEFSEFDFVNIFNTVELDSDFDTFLRKHMEYFEKMKNYISHSKLEEISARGNYYYRFVPTAGFNCFVITKSELKIVKTE